MLLLRGLCYLFFSALRYYLCFCTHGAAVFENIGVINLGTYLLGALFIILLPGPNSLFVLATAAARGVRPGYLAAVGILVGDTILITLTAAGAGTLLQTVPVLFYVLRALGAGYLFYLGVRILWSLYKPSPAEANPTPEVLENKVKHNDYFSKALVLSLLNPKAILFLLSFFVQFVDPSKGHPWLAFMVLGAFLQLFSVVYLSILIFGGNRLADSFRRQRVLAMLCNAAVAILFIVFAARMAFGVA